MKKVGNCNYFATEAVNDIPKEIYKVYLKGLLELGEDFSHNLVKVNMKENEVSLLNYEGLHLQPHPYLKESIKIYLDKDKDNLKRNYKKNQMILHRLETMLSSDNPRISELEELTELEEEKNMFANSRKIGRKNYWNNLCHEKNMEESFSGLVSRDLKESKAHKTARHRSSLSAPVRWAKNNNYLQSTILDYGCGKGADTELLAKEGFEVESFDPHYNPIDLEKLDYNEINTVLLNYVINVIKSPYQRVKILENIKKKAKKGTKLIVSARGYKSILRQSRKSDWDRVGDGFITNSGTFQKGFAMEELKTLLSLFGEIIDTKKLSGGRVVIIEL